MAKVYSDPDMGPMPNVNKTGLNDQYKRSAPKPTKAPVKPVKAPKQNFSRVKPAPAPKVPTPKIPVK